MTRSDARRVALVTGAARGIGRAVAIGLARRGLDVVVTDIAAQQSHLDAPASEVAASGQRAFPLSADISRKSDVAELVDGAMAAAGRIDALVNNAGILSWASVEEMREKQWDDVLAVNAKGTFLVTQAVLAPMKSQRYGRIVSVASMAAKRGAANVAHYCASKAAVAGFMRAVAVEAGPFGITANSVCPGIIVTEMGRQNLPDQASVDAWTEKTCLRRLGDPEDVVGPVAFFASEESGYVTGQSLNVCGGIIND